jgi:hypothetical protein
MRQLQVSLAQVDATGLAAILSRTDFPDRANDSVEVFRAQFNQTYRDVLEAISYTGENFNDLVALSMTVMEFKDLMEAALAQAATDPTAAWQSAESAHRLIDQAMTDRLEPLISATDDRWLSQPATTNLLIIALIVNWLGVALLIGVMVRIAQRSHRVFNLGLLIATVVLAGMAIAVNWAYQSADRQINQATQLIVDGRAAQQAATASWSAAANEVLLAGGQVDPTSQRLAVDQALAMVTKDLTAIQTTPLALSDAWSAVESLHQAIANQEPTAKDQLLTLAQPDSVWNHFNAATAPITATAVSAIAGNINNDFWRIGLIAGAGLVATASALAGFRRPLAEYR